MIIKESQLRNLIRKSILNEISNVANDTNVTVCSLDEFYKLLRSLGITKENVDTQDEYAFIEIGSTQARWNAEVNYYNAKNFEFNPEVDEFGGEAGKTNPEMMFKYQYYFPFDEQFENVLKLMYDDNQVVNNKTKKKGDNRFHDNGLEDTENNATCVNLSPGETNTGKKIAFYYAGAKCSSVEDYQAIKNFVDMQLQKNPDVKFIIHCRQGTSRSTAIGTYVARKISEIKQLDWEQYMNSFYEEHKTPNVPGKKHQFRVGRGTKSTHYPDGNTLKGLGDLEGWNEKGSKAPKSWAHPFIKQYGEMNDDRWDANNA